MTQVTETTLAKEFEKQPVLADVCITALGRSEFRNGSASCHRETGNRLQDSPDVTSVCSRHFLVTGKTLGNVLKHKLRALHGGELISLQLCELQLPPGMRRAHPFPSWVVWAGTLILSHIECNAGVFMYNLL